METSLCYQINPQIQVTPLDSSDERPRFLVEINDRMLEISEHVYYVIRFLQEKGMRNPDEIAAELRCRGLARANAMQVAAVLWKTLIPNHIVLTPEGEETPVASMRRKRSSYLTIKLPLISAEAIRPITNLTRVLFYKPVIWCVLALVVAAHLYFYLVPFSGFQWKIATLPLQQYLWLMLIMSSLNFIHELGHATACRFYNCRHGKIGWGIYIFMFVLYTDVTPAWKLTRKKRAMIDFGGMYFELIAVLIVLVVWLVTQHPLAMYVFLLLDLSILFSLNPIFRQDGYWLFSDLAGITNLRDTSLVAMRSFIAKLRGQTNEHLSSRMDRIPAKVRMALYAYSTLSLGFFGWLTWWVVSRTTGEIIPACPQQIQAISAAFAGGTAIWSAAVEPILRLLSYGLFVVFTAWALGRFFYGLILPGKVNFDPQDSRR